MATEAVTPMTKTEKRLTLPVSSMGTERTLKTIGYGSGTGTPRVYVQAGLHADEAPGYLVMHHLIDRLDQADAQGEIRGRILLVPVANPIGVGQWRDEFLQGRFDSFNSINFNRRHLDLTDAVADRIRGRLADTAAANVALIRRAMAEAMAAIRPADEAEALKHLLLSLAYDADIVLDLHCDYEAVMHLYVGTPLWPDAADLAAQMGAEATLLARNSGGHPYDEACSRIWWDLAERFPDAPIPPACLAATVELRGWTDVTHAMGRQDAENIFRFLQRRGVIEGTAPELPALRNPATPLRGVEHVTATAPGVVVFLKRPGARIAAGDVVAEIVDPLKGRGENRATEVRSRTAGILFSINRDRFARPGRILAKIAGETPLEDKGENLLTL